MPAIGNLVHETSDSTGSGNLTLTAVNGKQRISEMLTRLGLSYGDNGADNPVCFIQNRDAAEWEVAQCYLSDANTLVRASVLESSNSDSSVTFSAGRKDVSVDIDAATQSATEDWGSITGSVTLSDDWGSLS